MKYVLLILALFSVACFAELTENQLQAGFTNYMQKYSKSYGVDEFQYRYQVFKQNARFIDSFNGSFNLAMNSFGDLTLTEFSKMYLGFLGSKATPNSLPAGVPRANIPASIDWRTRGAVTYIKNQGQCGSCWSFSATGSQEGAWFLAGHTLVALSEQQLVDCSDAYGNAGCDGGLMDDAFRYEIAVGGLESETEYPYTAQDGTCQFMKGKIVSSIVSYHDVPSQSEADLTSDIGTIAPISVAIDASHSSFQFYSSGVYYEPACSATQLDHGVLAVGYSAQGSSDYYIVKNSWGTDWGMSGYIWMSRNRNNNCGIATMASYPCAAGEPNC